MLESTRVQLHLRCPLPEGMTIQIAPARALPLDWYRWRDAELGGPPLAPIVEGFTAPEGWSVTIVEVATDEGIRTHAFYAVFDLAVHAWATLPDDASAELRARVRASFTGAAPVWDDEICALGDL